MTRSALALAAVLCGCASKAPAKIPPDVSQASSESTPLEALEARLLGAHTLRIRARLATGGRIESHFEGTVVAGSGQKMRIEMEGAFGGRDASARLVCDGVKMHGGSREHSFDFEAPPALRAGIMIAFVRMGLTHNIAALSAGSPPDFSRRKGDPYAADDRVGASLPASPSGAQRPNGGPGPSRSTGRRPALTKPFGPTHARASPLKRRVIVHFPEGDMEVGEEYDELTVDAPVDEAAFTVAP